MIPNWRVASLFANMMPCGLLSNLYQGSYHVDHVRTVRKRNVLPEPQGTRPGDLVLGNSVYSMGFVGGIGAGL